MGAQEYRFQYLGAEQGLSNLGVRNLYQDRRGFLWVSTEGGVFRYDGQRFQAFGEDQGLPESSGVAFAETPSGRLLAGTETGLYRLNGSRFEKVALPSSGIIFAAGGLKPDEKGNVYAATGDGLVLLTETPQGELETQRIANPPIGTDALTGGILVDGDAVWYGCGRQLCRLSNGQVRVYGPQEGVRPARWTAIGKSQDGDLWLRGAGVGVAVLPKGGSSIRMIDAPLLRAGLSGVPAVDSQGDILFPTPDGLVIRTKNGWWKVGRAAGLQGVAYAVLQDREGSVWVGLAGHGLARWPGFRAWEFYSANGSLGSDLVFQVLPQADGTVWAGTQSGLMRGVRRGDAMIWRRQAGIGGVPIHAIRADRQGTLWLGTEMLGIAHLNPGSGAVEWIGHAQGLDGTSPFALEIDHNQRLWAATEEGLYEARLPFRRFDRVEQLPASTFWTIAEAADGSLWAGGVSGLYHLAEEKWERFTTNDGLSHNEVLALGAAKDGAIWVGYRFGSEIDKIEPENGKFAIIHVIRQQPGGTHLVYFLGFDAHGRLWSGTEHGVNVLDGGQWTHIDSNDGLAWDDCDLYGFAAQPNGEVWIGTSGGLAHYTPLAQTLPANPLTVVFTRLTLGRNDVTPSDQPSVRFGSNELVAQFSDLNFTHGM